MTHPTTFVEARGGLPDAFPTDETFTLGGDAPMDQQWMRVRRIEDYKCTEPVCPLCGGTAIPWGGWVHCDDKCGAVTWMQTGEILLPVKFEMRLHKSASALGRVGDTNQ